MLSFTEPLSFFSGRAEAAEELAAAYVGSLSLCAGQFSTNPGIVLAVDGEATARFIAAIGDALGGIPAQTMLTQSIQNAYVSGIDAIHALPGAVLVGTGAEVSSTCGRAHVYTVSGAEFAATPAFANEVFGPSSIIVTCTDLDEVAEVLVSMEGQLTATLRMASGDYPAARDLLPILEQRAGRIIANAWPTGVEVTHAMVHGGPFPATSDGRSTSVGTLAIDRFLRPVSYQDMPAALLPKVLLDGPGAALRRVDGRFEV